MVVRVLGGQLPLPTPLWVHPCRLIIKAKKAPYSIKKLFTSEWEYFKKF